MELRAEETMLRASVPLRPQTYITARPLLAKALVLAEALLWINFIPIEPKQMAPECHAL